MGSVANTESGPTSGPEPWRLAVLNRGSAAMAVLAALWAGLFLFRDAYDDTRFYLVACLVLILPPAVRSLPYRLRGYLLVGNFTLLTGFVASFAGPAIGGVMAGLCAIIVAGLLFDIKHAVAVWGATAVLFMTGLHLTSSPWSPFNPQLLDPRVSENLYRLGSTYLLFSSTIALGVSVVVNRLSKSLAQAKAAQHAAEQARDQREQALNQMIEAQKFKVMAQLSGGVAHDVNNSLQVLVAYSELLQDDEQSAQEVRQMAEEMHTVCLDTSKMARQLLTLGKRVVLDRQAVDLGAEIDKMERSLRKLLPADVKLEVDCPLGHFASVDTVQLNQALLNLSLNASHAMPQGGRLRISLLPRADDMLALTVNDTGTGIEADTLKNIFEPFFTTKGSGGTGLGLSTVKAITEQHGGQLLVNSKPGSGTSFEMVLPSCPPASEKSTSSESAGISLHGTRVLLADDDPRVRSAIEHMLDSAGAHVTCARSADEALLTLEHAPAPFDALCTDAVMPGRPTKDLLDVFARTHPRAAILVCSGYVESELLRRGIQAEEYYHLAKPFTSEALLQRLRKALRHKQQQAISRSA